MPTPMTYAEFEQAAWDAAPTIRKRVAGRQTFNELLAATVQSWSPEAAAACQDDDGRRRFARELLERVRNRHQAMTGHTQQEYGFIWMFLLAAVASAVIQWLIKRWLDNHFPAEQVAAWQQELAT